MIFTATRISTLGGRCVKLGLDANFSIVDTTTIRIASGKAGRINVGQEVPVLSEFTQDNQGQRIQSVQYRASGPIVDIKPQNDGFKHSKIIGRHN